MVMKIQILCQKKVLNGMSDYLPGRMSDYVSNRVPGSARHAAGQKFPK